MKVRRDAEVGGTHTDAKRMNTIYVGDKTWMNIRLQNLDHYIGRVYIEIFGDVSATKSEFGRAPSAALLQVIQFGFRPCCI